MDNAPNDPQGGASPPPPQTQPGTAPPVPPLPASSPATASPAAPPPSSPSPPAGGTAPVRDSVRSNIKIAGATMVILAVLAAWQLSPLVQGLGEIQDEAIVPVQDRPGGTVTVSLLGASAAKVATVTLRDVNGTRTVNATLSGPEPAELQAPAFAGHLEVRWENQTWTRRVLSAPSLDTHVAIEPGTSPAADETWVQPDFSLYRTIGWTVMATAAFLLVAGVFTFRMRAPRLAFAGAAVLLLCGLVVLALVYRGAGPNILALLQPLLIVGMGAFAIWAVRQGRDRFQPVRLGPITL